MSVVGLENALEQYVNSKEHSLPFDIKTVPVSAKPLTATEKKRSPVSLEISSSKKDEKKLSRLDVYAGLLIFVKVK